MTGTDVTRSALMHLSQQPGLKTWATRFEPLGRLAMRFVAGETLAEAVEAVRVLNDAGCLASFDHLEEEVTTMDQAQAEVDEYARLLRQIDTVGVNANVSIKLTQLGLRMDPARCLEKARAVVAEAARRGNFVRVDMEGSALTSATLDMVHALHREFGEGAVGAVLQSALRRTPEDLERLLSAGIRVRLCKGAYLEPPSVAYPAKSDVDAAFLALMRRLLDSGGYHGIATHDERMIDATLEHARVRGLGPERFELQMLYGIRRDLQRQLVASGHRVRVYVPYGRSWYPYFMRRLAERPANLWFVAKSLVRP